VGARADQNDYVLHVVEERRIKFVQLWFTDVLGIPKSFQITPAELENALADGMTFDGSAIDGFSRDNESDVCALPDPATFTVLPGSVDTGRMFCDIVTLDGTPFDGCPRNVLRRTLTGAYEQGFVCYAAPEIEYFYFGETAPGEPPTPLDHGSYFDLSLSDLGSDLRRDAVFALENAGIAVENSRHEDAPSQHEIDLRATDALSMADSIVTARLLIRQVAERVGVVASFMPKPLEGVQGSGMHTHFSLFREEDNLLWDPSNPDGLSPLARSFMAGILLHGAEITAVTNQWVNSYKRLVLGYEAPTAIGWSRTNRGSFLRIPGVNAASAESFRVEYRALDPACNPYLAFSLIIGAGLEGIARGCELPDAVEDQTVRQSLLPHTLDDAIDAFEGSEFVRETLGSHVTEWFIRNKRDEWRRYSTHVSEFERRQYLGIV